MERANCGGMNARPAKPADKAATLVRGEFINALSLGISKMERELSAMKSRAYGSSIP